MSDEAASGREKDTARANATCPICQRAASTDYRPFCCKRCADVDLARWLGGRYAIPAATEEDGDGEDYAPQPRE